MNPTPTGDMVAACAARCEEMAAQLQGGAFGRLARYVGGQLDTMPDNASVNAAVQDLADVAAALLMVHELVRVEELRRAAARLGVEHWWTLGRSELAEAVDAATPDEEAR